MRIPTIVFNDSFWIILFTSVCILCKTFQLAELCRDGQPQQQKFVTLTGTGQEACGSVDVRFQMFPPLSLRWGLDMQTPCAHSARGSDQL